MIPKVSKEFALELKRRFKPFEPSPGFDRDELMQSVGEQRVINWILHHSNNTVVQSSLEVQSIKEEESIPQIEKYSIWKRFTTRFGN